MSTDNQNKKTETKPTVTVKGESDSVILESLRVSAAVPNLIQNPPQPKSKTESEKKTSSQ